MESKELVIEDDKDINVEYVKKYKLTKDEKVLEILISRNNGLVRDIVKRYYKHGVLFEDAMQEGRLGLVEAALRFDPNRGNKFSTYAVHWIRKNIIKYITENLHTIHYSKEIVQSFIKIKKFEDELISKEHYEPSNYELATLTHNTLEFIETYRQFIIGTTTLDVNAFIYSKSGHQLPLYEILKDENIEDFEVSLSKKTANQILRQEIKSLLNEQQYNVVMLRYGFVDNVCKTTIEAGKILKVSKQRVSQVESKAKRILRKCLTYGKPQYEQI